MLGAARASDYGREMARSLSRGLAVSGVTVVAALRDGIAAAAHEGALEAGCASIAVLEHGLDKPPAGSLRVLRRRVQASGCVVAELPGAGDGRRWGARAADRTLAALAAAAVLFEDEAGGAAAHALELAKRRGIPVGAVPGPVSSMQSAGPHAAIVSGAALIGNTRDVLDLLSLTTRHTTDRACTGTAGAVAPGDGSASPGAAAPMRGPSGLAPRLAGVLDHIGAGLDTPEALVGDRSRAGETMAALAELELLGLVRRTANGRYVPCEPATERDGTR